jgi:hypothetical protein
VNTPTNGTGWVVWIVGVLIAGGLLKVLYDLYAARGDRKRKRGENDVLMIETINGVAEKALARADAVRTEFDRYRNRLDSQLRKHDGWDRRVVAKLEAATGETVEPPPPLYVEDHS